MPVNILHIDEWSISLAFLQFQKQVGGTVVSFFKLETLQLRAS